MFELEWIRIWICTRHTARVTPYTDRVTTLKLNFALYSWELEFKWVCKIGMSIGMIEYLWGCVFMIFANIYKTKKKMEINKSTGIINPSGCLWAHLPNKLIKKSTGTIPWDAFELAKLLKKEKCNFCIYQHTKSAILQPKLVPSLGWGHKGNSSQPRA